MFLRCFPPCPRPCFLLFFSTNKTRNNQQNQLGYLFKAFADRIKATTARHV